MTVKDNVQVDAPTTVTPAVPSARFSGQAAHIEESLKESTVGLVKLDDFRKRRSEALESGRSTPVAGDRYA
jgi:protein FAM50